MRIVDGPLVEYFESCRADLGRQGFHVLILALVREADAPHFYEDLTRYWDSINDVTGKHIVFAVAGGCAAEQVGVGAIHGSGYYSEQMAVAEPSAVRIERLRQMAGHRRDITIHLDSIAEANTGQISALCDHLGVEERNLPCLHLTHLASGKSRVLPLTRTPGATVYTTCKAIVSHLQPSFRAFDNAARVPEIRILMETHREREESDHKIRSAQQELSNVDKRLSPPHEVQERNELSVYFRRRLQERPEFTPIRIRELVEMCEDPNRTPGDVGMARAMLKELAPIPRLRMKARRMIDVSFSAQAIEFEVNAERHDRTQKRVELLATIADLERENRKLREQEVRLRAQLATTIRIQQAPILKSIEVSFLSLQTVETSSIRPQGWDVFLSYPAQDRDLAISLFRGLESVTKVFMDWFCLLPGQDWQSFLPDVQRSCRFTIALISRHSQNAHFHISEMQRAINFMREGTHKVLPVYLDDHVAPPFGLEQVHGIYWSNCPGGDPIATLRSSVAQLRHAAEAEPGM